MNRIIPIHAVDRDAPSDPTRRRFLALMAATAALTGAGCSGPPRETILPYVRMPETLVPGEPVFYATAYVRNGYAHGVLVESNMGRPTKVEGNPLHPQSRGATDVYAQAAVLELWDPDRSQSLLHAGQIGTWQQLVSELHERRARFERDGGAGLRILGGAITSPTLAVQLRALQERYPRARLHCYDPLHDDHAFEGARLAFSRPVDTLYRFDHARIVLTLDADFLSHAPGSVRYAYDFAQTRRPGGDDFSRLYALEASPGLVGAMADERLARTPAEVERFVWGLAARLGAAPKLEGESPAPGWEAALAKQLSAQRGASIIVAGPALSPQTHALVHALNARLGNIGKTIFHIEPVEMEPRNHVSDLAALVADMRAGVVDTLVMLGGNPAYDAPADLAFADALARVPLSLHLSLYRDETSRRATWHIPQAHDFETWSDARAYDGTATIIQPLIAPLHGGRPAHELLALLTSGTQPSAHDVVRGHWRRVARNADFEARWQQALRQGFIDGSAARPLNVAPRRPPSPPEFSAPPLIALFVPDASALDGRYANNAWLQELPRPLSTFTWDNAALIAPATARELALQSGDVVMLEAAGAEVQAPVWVLPGHAERCVTLPLGCGRAAAGQVGDAVGFDAYRLRTGATAKVAPVALTRTDLRHVFALRQEHDRMEGRGLVRHATLGEFRRVPRFATDEARERLPKETLYPSYPYETYAWAMSIDLNSCIGCRACTIACQSENNIPVVGPEHVREGREMHWIRIDRYYDGAEENPRTFFQPVPCMHCEHAPCEEVCPVGATMHDSEGLNVQVYNRCVGTRFCSNNCPYKVRRFNFLKYNSDDPSLAAQRNPEVTVRRRGVMEKCTYCLQRITRARIEAEQRGVPLRDGEVVTACQAVCPTQAIVFGDLNDPTSRVNAARQSPLHYALLAELNTRPRTTYLARVTNPDPELDHDG